MKIVLYGDKTWRLRFWLKVLDLDVNLISSKKPSHLESLLESNDIEMVVVTADINIFITNLEKICAQNKVPLLDCQGKPPLDIAEAIRDQLA